MKLRFLFVITVLAVLMIGLMAVNGGNGSSMNTVSTGEELITLAPGSVTSVQDFFPANSINRGLSCRIVTAVTGTNLSSIQFLDSVNSYILGNIQYQSGVTDFSAGTRFTLAFQGSDPKLIEPLMPSSVPAKLVINTDASSVLSGSIRCTAYYDQFVAPTS